MGQRTGNIARWNALMPTEERRATMEAEFRDRLTKYRAAMTLAQEMLKQGLISDEEYSIIDTIMTKKYGLSSSTIFQ